MNQGGQAHAPKNHGSFSVTAAAAAARAAALALTFAVTKERTWAKRRRQFFWRQRRDTKRQTVTAIRYLSVTS